MKVEIGESLMLSWLRHVKHCQMVQTNWKPSANWELHNEKQVIEMMQTVSETIKDRYMLNIFKNNQSHLQLLRQGEIDVLGIELQVGRIAEIYSIDTAFHENGLNYGTSDQTVERVIKKMVRTTMIMVGYFNLTKGKIIFAAPQIGRNIYNPLSYLIHEVNDLYRSINLDFEFILYGNESFRDHVLSPVKDCVNVVADTSELFMRSIQMNNLFSEKPEAMIETEKNIVTSKVTSKHVNNRRGKVYMEQLNNEHKVAYYLSRFEHDQLFPKYNQTQAFEEISRRLGVKLTTLRNKRDMFDPFCNNIKTRGPKRKGWWQNDSLPIEMDQVYKKYLNLSEEEIEKEIREILKL